MGSPALSCGTEFQNPGIPEMGRSICGPGEKGTPASLFTGPALADLQRLQDGRWKGPGYHFLKGRVCPGKTPHRSGWREITLLIGTEGSRRGLWTSIFEPQGSSTRLLNAIEPLLWALVCYLDLHSPHRTFWFPF